MSEKLNYQMLESLWVFLKKLNKYRSTWLNHTTLGLFVYWKLLLHGHLYSIPSSQEMETA